MPVKPKVQKDITDKMKLLKTRKERVALKSKEIKLKTKLGKFIYNG